MKKTAKTKKMLAMVIIHTYLERVKKTSPFYLERKEQERKDKARKDEEDASNGKLSCEHYSRK